MSILDQHWFSNISRPSRYIGNEINSVRKEPGSTEVSIALAFPDVYEVGMSHLGLKILYHILNGYRWLAAERIFSPWVDLERELKRRKITITTLESNRPLSTFDIVGFSLQHELCYTNVLTMLDLSGIPLLSKQRKENDPLVIAGGPACFSPEPVADFFDVMVIGDGEDASVSICRAVREAKQKGIKNKEELLSQICRIRGAYVPSYFSVRYREEGTVQAIEPLVPDYPAVEKAVVSDIDDYPFPDSQVVPFAGVVHDRLVIEISRGCTRGCRFCQAGMIYRPVRERSPESILEKSKRALELTGYDDLSLLSLSSGDYSCMEPLLEVLMERHADEKVSLSLPSLRADSLSPSLIDLIKRVRKTGFTLAPEAGNDRLRRIINKGIVQKDILETARAIYGAGWDLIKLYFMIGLPLEREGDIEDIIDLSRQVVRLSRKKGKRERLNVSVSTFVPKSHTPFMWTPQISLEESKRRIQFIREGLRGGPIRVKWNQPELSWLEGIFSRGDRRLGKVLMEAWRLGARFDAWGEHFNMEIWQDAFNRTGVDPDTYVYRERSLAEVLPWEHIRSGVTKNFLMREWKRAQTGEFTPDCRKKCLECGVCDHKTLDPVLFEGWNLTRAEEKPIEKTGPAISKKLRLTFRKMERAKHLSHLELIRVFIRAFRRAGLHLVYSSGFHPMPKISFACALPVGTESMQETVDIEVTGLYESDALRTRVNRELPPGIHVTGVAEIATQRKKEQIKESHFLITLRGVQLKEERLERFLKSDYFPVVKVNKKGEHKIDVRPLVKSMSLISPSGIKLVVKQTTGPGSKPADIVKGVFSLNDSHMKEMKILKTAQILA